MKIIVTVGCSGAGKSTWSNKKWKEDPLNTIVVGRDKIRELLFGYTETTVSEYYRNPNNSKLEKQVTVFEDTLIHDGLNMGKTVIVDATHLKKAYLERFKFFNVPVEFVVFKEPLEILLQRNLNRVRQVPEDVIKKQYNQLSNLVIPENFTPIKFENLETKPSCIVVDLDGTVCEKGERNPFDWKRVGEDEEIKAICNMVWSLSRGSNVSIIFCSGRDAVCYDESFEWINSAFPIMDFKLMMRPKNDMRPDWIVKEEMWREIAETHYIEALVDDRNQVVRRARALGLKVLQVEYGNF